MRPSKPASMRIKLRPRILCVDDEPMVLQSLAASLRKHFEVVGASDGASALALLDGEGGFPVVVSDYRMPGMNGGVLLNRVRERFPRTVRILLTGAGADGDDVSGDPDLVFRFLSKPCPRDVLIRTIQEALDRWKST